MLSFENEYYFTVLADVIQMVVVEQVDRMDRSKHKCLVRFPSVTYYLNGRVLKTAVDGSIVENPMTAPAKRAALDQIHLCYQTALVAWHSHFHVADDATG